MASKFASRHRKPIAAVGLGVRTSKSELDASTPAVVCAQAAKQHPHSRSDAITKSGLRRICARTGGLHPLGRQRFPHSRVELPGVTHVDDRDFLLAVAHVRRGGGLAAPAAGEGEALGGAAVAAVHRDARSDEACQRKQ